MFVGVRNNNNHPFGNIRKNAHLFRSLHSFLHHSHPSLFNLQLPTTFCFCRVAKTIATGAFVAIVLALVASPYEKGEQSGTAMNYSLLPPVWGSPSAQPASDAAPEAVSSVPQNPRNLPINDNNSYDESSDVIDLTQDSEEEEEVVEDVQDASKHGADKDDDANVSVEELDNTLSLNNDNASSSSSSCNKNDTEESLDSAASSQASISFETQLPEESTALEGTKKPASSNALTEKDASAEQESSEESSSEGGQTSISNKDTLNDNNVHEPTESDSEESKVVASETSTEMQSETQGDEEVPGGVGTHMSCAKSTRNVEQSKVEDDVEVVVVEPSSTSRNTRQIKSAPVPKKKPAKEAKHQAENNGVVRETRQRRAIRSKPSDPSLTGQSLQKKAPRSACALERSNSRKSGGRRAGFRKQPKVAPCADSPDNAGDSDNHQPFEDSKKTTRFSPCGQKIRCV